MLGVIVGIPIIIFLVFLVYMTYEQYDIYSGIKFTKEGWAQAYEYQKIDNRAKRPIDLHETNRQCKCMKT